MQHILPYMISPRRSLGMSDSLIVQIVFDVVTRRHSSVPKDFDQKSWYFGFFRRCLYSSSFPVSSSNTAATRSAEVREGCHCCAPLCVISRVSLICSATSCVRVRLVWCCRVLCAGGLKVSFSCVMVGMVGPCSLISVNSTVGSLGDVVTLCGVGAGGCAMSCSWSV